MSNIYKKDSCRGIYGIYIDDNLIYIGKTNASFQKRFQQHQYNLANPQRWGTQQELYSTLQSAKSLGRQVKLIPLVSLEDIKYLSVNELSNRDIECMELAMITYFKQHGHLLNIQGVSKPYTFTV